MPDKRSHRGPHPEDAHLFAPATWPTLQSAVHDLSWLLTHHYTIDSALKLVGDHHQLDSRQRRAIMRSSCSDQSLTIRRTHQIPPTQIAGLPITLDGYNVLTTLESALGGGILLRARDSCLRDLASLHGHYKRVAETAPALELLGQTLTELHITHAHILLDAPVSNSGRLKTIMTQLAAQHAWPWTITLVPDPDPILAQSPEIIATADSEILDGSHHRLRQSVLRNKQSAIPSWLNLTHQIITRHFPTATIIPLDG